MVLFQNPDLPQGVSADLYFTAIIIELIFFGFLLLIVLLSIKKSIERRTNLNILMVIILIGFSASLFFTAFAKISVLFLRFKFEDGVLFDIIALIITAFIHCLFMIFALQVFTNMPSKRKYILSLIYFILYIPIIVGFFLAFLGLDFSIYLIFHLVLSFVLCGVIIENARKSAKSAELKLHKVGMWMIFLTGLCIAIFYTLAMISWFLIESNVLKPFNLLYFISWVFLIFAIFLTYSGFFQPNWLKKLIKSEDKN